MKFYLLFFVDENMSPEKSAFKKLHILKIYMYKEKGQHSKE